MTRVEPWKAPIVRTPNRQPNQWLMSGRALDLRLPCSGCGWWPGACQCHHREQDHENSQLIELIEEEER